MEGGLQLQTETETLEEVQRGAPGAASLSGTLLETEQGTESP